LFGEIFAPAGDRKKCPKKSLEDIALDKELLKINFFDFSRKKFREIAVKLLKEI